MSIRFCVLHDAESVNLAKWVSTDVLHSDESKAAFSAFTDSSNRVPVVWQVSLSTGHTSTISVAGGNQPCPQTSSGGDSCHGEPSIPPAPSHGDSSGSPPGDCKHTDPIAVEDNIWIAPVRRLVFDWKEELRHKGRTRVGVVGETNEKSMLLIVMVLWDAFAPSSKRAYATAKAEFTGVDTFQSAHQSVHSIHTVIQLLNAKHGTANWPKTPSTVFRSFQKTVLSTIPLPLESTFSASERPPPQQHLDPTSRSTQSTSTTTTAAGSGGGGTEKKGASVQRHKGAEAAPSPPTASTNAAGATMTLLPSSAPSAIMEALEAGGGECFFSLQTNEGPDALEAQCRVVYDYCTQSNVGCTLLSCTIPPSPSAAPPTLLLPEGFLHWLITPHTVMPETLSETDTSTAKDARRHEVGKPPMRIECELFLRRRHTSLDDIIELRLSMCGNVDSGKSTLTSVLTRGCRDDGRGFARSFVFRHRHEQDTGRTSSVSEHYVGFSATGEVTNHTAVDTFSVKTSNSTEGSKPVCSAPATGAAHKQAFHPSTHASDGQTPSDGQKTSSTNHSKHHIAEEVVRSYRPQELSQTSDKLITLYDLAGHEKYLKTTVLGMTRGTPDYACVVISANNGIQRMTKEHLILCLALKLPFFIVVTRIDSTPPNVKADTMASIGKMLKSKVVQRKPFVLKSMSDVIVAAKHLRHLALVPVIELSNVTGEGLALLTQLLHLLPTRHRWAEEKQKPQEMIIDNIFFVPGVGTVVAGIVTQGVFHANDTVLLGPDALGQFRPTTIKSIHIRGVNVHHVEAGNDAAFCLKKEKRSAIRKGNVLLARSSVPQSQNHGAGMTAAPKAYWQFDAEVTVLYHATTISVNYEPVIHSATVLQCARIMEVSNKDVLRTGDHASVRFHFVYRPEFLKVGQRIIFREGRTKGIGVVTGLTEASDLKKFKRSKAALSRGQLPAAASEGQSTK